jgi:Zn-dependent alcohol dehydrogenase
MSQKDKPQYCFDTHNATQKILLESGQKLTSALGIGAFAEQMLVAAGQCTPVVGVPTPDMMASGIPLVDHFSRGGALRSSWHGDCPPSQDYSALIDLCLAGRLPLEKFVCEEIGLGGVEVAFETMRRGGALRSVVIP